MPFTNVLTTELDTNKEQSGLQIDAATLAKYFGDKDQIAKTASTWNESNKNQLWSLESKDKESLKAAIDDYLRNHLTVKKSTGEYCPAVEIISQCKTYAEAIRKVKDPAYADGKNINICAALLSLHSFLDGKGKLTYPNAQKYALLFCDSDYVSTVPTKPVEGGNGKPVEGGNGKPVEGGNGKPVEGGNDLLSNSPTIDPIPENTPDNKNTTEAMDGVPTVITSGIDRVDNKERKDYLTGYVDKELQGVVNEYFAKDELDNNKKNENALIIGFLNQAFSKDALMKAKWDQPEDKAGLLNDKSYEQSVVYYQALLNELKNNPRMDGRKLVIPESATFGEDGKVTLVYPDKVNAGIGRPNKKIEGKEKDRYMAALDKLTENTNFLIDNTKEKVYTLGLNKVDTELPTEGEKKTVWQKNIDLAVKTEYYSAIQLENTATNDKLKELNTEYTASLGVIQKTTSDILAENKKLNDGQLKPEDKIKAQVKLVSLNQQLLEEELKLLTTASLISTLAGEGATGVQSKEQIATRMDKIKVDIKTNAEKMTTWIGENEEALKKLNNAEITSQIETIKKASTEEYVKSQENIVDSLKNVMNNSNTLFARINKPYQESEKLIKTYESEKTYWMKKIEDLNKANPRYNSLKTEYEKNVVTLNKNIMTEVEKQTVLLSEFKDASSKATGEREKALRLNLQNGEKLYMVQKESSEELKNLAQLGDRSSTLSDKESLITPDITEQTKDNQSIVDKKGEEVNKEATEYSTKLWTLQADIDRKEQEVKTELEKAANNQSYDLEKVTKNQFELLTHYQEKQQYLDKYNDTYYKDQQNYQRNFDNQLIGTIAQKEHTEQNVKRLEDYIAEIDKDIANKKQFIVDTEAQITALVEKATTDPVYQNYLNTQVAKLTSDMNTTILELTGDDSLIDPNNRRKTLQNFKECEMEYAVAGSLYDLRNSLEVSLMDEKDQSKKRGQAADFEQARIDYIGTNAQTAIMKEKIDFYGEYNTMLLGQIAEYNKTISKNTADINDKKSQLQIIAGDTESEKLLNADIAKLTSENESLTKLRDDISSRQAKLQTVLDTAKGEYAKMVINNDNAKKVMNTNEKTLLDNKTPLYKDQATTLYDAGKLDEERMKYKPYVGSEVKTEEVKEVVDDGMNFNENDVKYINKITEIVKSKGVIVPEVLPLFNTVEEAKGKIGILVIDQNGVKSRTIANFNEQWSPTRPDYTIMESGARLYRGEDVSQDEKNK